MQKKEIFFFICKVLIFDIIKKCKIFSKLFNFFSKLFNIGTVGEEFCLMQIVAVKIRNQEKNEESRE